MEPYRSGETPRVGDRVEFDPQVELLLRRRPRGSKGTVYHLGDDLLDPLASLVMVEWDQPKEFPDDDCFVFHLRKVAS